MLGCGKSHSDKNISSEKDAITTVGRQSSAPAIRKILCLHGGGGNAKDIQSTKKYINQIRKALQRYAGC